MKILSVIGTRPQYVKAAVVTRALREDGRFTEVTVDTGQHYDEEMSAFLLDDLPDVKTTRNLGLHGDDPDELLARMQSALDDVLAEEQPDVVLVYGDTNSTLAGARAAAGAGAALGHVEAGLRSFNDVMREERIRVEVDHEADLLFCPTPVAVANLEREQVTAGVHHVGDVMYDAALAAREATSGSGDDLMYDLGVEPGTYAIATVHRAETTDDTGALAAVMKYLDEQARDTPIVFPVHPRTRKAIDAAGIETTALITCEPVGYLDMTRLLANAQTVYTDSGGLQKEAYFHRVPCVTLRSETEWVETIDAGWNRLWTTPDYQPRRDITDYGDGHAGEAIVEVLAAHLGATA